MRYSTKVLQTHEKYLNYYTQIFEIKFNTKSTNKTEMLITLILILFLYTLNKVKKIKVWLQTYGYQGEKAKKGKQRNLLKQNEGNCLTHTFSNNFFNVC